MSKFTGKSDFYDLIHMQYSPLEVLKGDIYTYDNDKIDFYGDDSQLIPYYPYLIGSMCAEKKSNSFSSLVVHLSKESYIDSMEKDRIFYTYYPVAYNILDGKLSNTYGLNPYDLNVITNKLKPYFKNIIKRFSKVLSKSNPHLQHTMKDLILKILDNTYLNEFVDKRQDVINEYKLKTSNFNPKIAYLEQQVLSYNEKKL